MVITIDGPAASGKSSVAKVLARKLNFYYLYTGLLYRGAAYVLVKVLNISDDQFANLTLDDLYFIKDIEYLYENNIPQIYFKGQNITANLKDLEIDQVASKISANRFVRKALLDLQRDVAEKYNIIADGRDCGSVVFPNAQYKFFLTASLDVRALRKSKMDGLAFDVAKEELQIRDQRDKNRDVAPLIVPEDAIIIDNSKMSEEETMRAFLQHIKLA